MLRGQCSGFMDNFIGSVAARSVLENSKKSTETWDHWKLLSRCGVLQHEVIVALKSVEDCPRASDAVR